MSILGRYILRELAGPLLFGLLAFTSLFISVDLVQLVRMAVDYGASLTVVVQLIALRLPQGLVYTLPM
ncbi:MAG: LptF/LptG family permease, partial [Limnochordales bacterium]